MKTQFGNKPGENLFFEIERTSNSQSFLVGKDGVERQIKIEKNGKDFFLNKTKGGVTEQTKISDDDYRTISSLLNFITHNH